MGHQSTARFVWEFRDGFAGFAPDEWMRMIEERIASGEHELVYRVRNRIYRIEAPAPGGAPAPALCVKAFATPEAFRSLHYARIGSKAARSFRHARHLEAHGVGTPRPVGYVEQWRGRRLGVSHFITEYVAGATDLYSEMHRLLCEDPDCHRYIALLRRVAREIARMHDCGFQHNDLAGQNIMLQRGPGEGWASVGFIDLNRGRILPALSLRQRARDLAKLEIPSFLRRIFFHIYFGDAPIPPAFARWEGLYRFRITFHNESRKYRHPVRHWRHSRNFILLNNQRPGYRDTWLWDERTGQPSIVLDGKDRRKYRSKADMLGFAAANALHLPGIWMHYRKVLRGAFKAPVALRGRMGICLEVTPERMDVQLSMLRLAPGIPVLVRVYHHRGEKGLEETAAFIRDLHAAGHEVSIGLIQWRFSILQPETWRKFAAAALERLHPYVRRVEVGHAVNRVKWGVWRLREAAELWRTVAELARRHPHIELLGPAVNDFEYHFYPPLLRRMERKPDGLSCHLYVDRRGAPENRQGPFSLLEKCALGRAIADHFGASGFYITETNWPLLDSGTWSPIACPYAFPGETESELHVSPDTYAAYMVRYYLISLCSGCVEKIWWWRVHSRGFGLVDDVDPENPRPGREAFAFMIRALGDATFMRHERDGPLRRFVFDTCVVMYALSPCAAAVPAGHAQLHDIQGRPIKPGPDGAIALSESPVYCLRPPGE
jgi:tRNA A-37 threonylcarbamoyl transferase component Bud32